MNMSATTYSSIKRGTPTEDEIEALGAKIGKKWKKLGRRLGLDEESLEEIRNAYDELSERGYQMLRKWKQRQGSAATYRALRNALENSLVDHKKLAQQFCYVEDDKLSGYTRSTRRKVPSRPVPKKIETENTSGTSKGKLPSRQVPKEIETEEVLGATGGTWGTSLGKEQEDSSTFKSGQKRKNLAPSNHEPALKIRVDVDTMKSADQNTQNKIHQETSSAPLPSTHTLPSSTGATSIAGSVAFHSRKQEEEDPGNEAATSIGGPAAGTFQGPNPVPAKEKVLHAMASIANNYINVTPPTSQKGHYSFLEYMEKMRFAITGVKVESLVITVKCESLEALETLWKDYSSGHLGDVIQRCFVTEEILTGFNLAELTLKTKILEEDYEAYKMFFEKESAARGNMLQIVRRGLESFDVSSPKGLQGYVTYITDELCSAGLVSVSDSYESSSGSNKTGHTDKEPPSIKNLTDAMNGDQLKQFVSIHVEEGSWQVVVQLLNELFHDKRWSEYSSIRWFAHNDAESKDSRSLILSWWPTKVDKDLITLSKVLTETDCRLFKGLLLAWPDTITDEGVKHLAEALSYSNCALKSIYLSCNSTITDDGVKYLAEALKHENCALNILDLSENRTITDDGVKHLAEALKHENCALNSLNLSGNRAITDEGVKHLAEALNHENCALNSLDLSGNDTITDKGVKHLAEALKHENCALNSLDLSRNDTITDKGVKHLAEALQHKNCALKSLNLSENRKITDEGVKHLAEALKHGNYKLVSTGSSHIKVTAKD